MTMTLCRRGRRTLTHHPRPSESRSHDILPELPVLLPGICYVQTEFSLGKFDPSSVAGPEEDLIQKGTGGEDEGAVVLEVRTASVKC